MTVASQTMSPVRPPSQVEFCHIDNKEILATKRGKGVFWAQLITCFVAGTSTLSLFNVETGTHAGSVDSPEG